ncbi:hypothetical protein GGR54DRAFT_403849 [Hypoxylon sp. NC1633]|nr:hypothetical protein GGR54DRAFT_403849 [Hypoxylon sp. NC1633]
MYIASSTCIVINGRIAAAVTIFTVLNEKVLHIIRRRPSYVLHFPPQQSDMSASLAPECNEVKERYDTCFLKWYSEKYLRGNGKADDNECSNLFKDYQKCLQVALKERGIDKLLEEAREDSKESDALHMKKK